MGNIWFPNDDTAEIGIVVDAITCIGSIKDGSSNKAQFEVFGHFPDDRIKFSYKTFHAANVDRTNLINLLVKS